MPVHAWAMFWFCVIVAIKFSIIAAPPVWDTAMGVFPAAVWLSENNFDLLTLLHQDGWWGGGPNVHPLSLATWIIALLLWTGVVPTTAFIVLHLLTFTLTAIGLALLMRIAATLGFAPIPTFLTALFVLLCPLVLVQAGYMYTEIPVMVCSIAAVDNWLRRRINTAVGLVGLALFIKFSAVALAAAMILLLVFGLRQNWRSNVIRATVLGVLVVLARILPDLIGRSVETAGNWGSPSLLLHQLLLRMQAIPDIFALLVLGVCGAVVFGLRSVAGAVSAGSAGTHQNQAVALIMLTPILFFGAMLVGSLTGQLVLPRYLVPILPFALLSALIGARELGFSGGWQALLLAMVCGFFALNTNGRFYTPNYSSFSVVERTHAYRDFHRTKVDAIAAFASQPQHIPAYVTREIYYMVSNPKMGYLDSKRDQTYPVFRPPYRNWSLSDFPDEFILVRASAIHGGRQIDRILEQALDQDYLLVEQVFEISGFSARVYHLRR